MVSSGGFRNVRVKAALLVRKGKPIQALVSDITGERSVEHYSTPSTLNFNADSRLSSLWVTHEGSIRNLFKIPYVESQTVSSPDSTNRSLLGV